MAESSPRTPGAAWRSVLQRQSGASHATRDLVAEEVPVAVHVDGAPFAVMMLSPLDLEDFAFGFAFTERAIPAADVVSVSVQETLDGIAMDIRTAVPHAPSTDARALPGRSGCGICGSRHLEDVVKRPAAVGPGVCIAGAALASALDALQHRQPLNVATGAIHAAAWCDATGALVLVREDVGRHNALDKVVGAMLRQNIDPAAGFALVTSRASYEMVTKAALAGVPLLVALSAPTALAIDLAQDCGLTLVGFARPGRQVIYTHAHRLPAAETGRG